MNEEELARRLAAHLADAGDGLDDRVLGRLRSARERALTAQRRPVSRGHRSSRPVWRAVAAIATVLMLIAVGDTWLATTEEQEEIDAALLTDDLPIDAYLDQDFKTWLERG